MTEALTRPDILRLATAAQLDERTVARALKKGLGALRSEYSRERLRKAAEKQGVKLR